MLKTKLVDMFLIGLAMVGLSFGQAGTAVAATTASQTSHAASTHKAAVVSSKTKASKKAQLVKKAGPKAPSLSGLASIYSDKLSGRKTASGQRFSQEKMTAAHRSLPIGTRVLVTNLHNNRTVEVFINDRGPHYRDRVIDLTSAAASQLGMKKRGFFRVKLEVLNKPSV
jgi:rare lipoprotein A